MSLASEKKAVLSAIDVVIALNNEAGTSNESLTALLRVVSEEREKAVFENFCKDIMTCVHGCFGHFSSVMPHLAKVKAHRDFHQARMKSIPALWQSFASASGLAIDPLNFQAVSRQLFDVCMEELFEMLQAPAAAAQTSTEVKLLADEENVLRYASGYVGMKLLKQFRKGKGSKAAQFRECLSHMSKSGEDSSFYAYTMEWINSIDRGGLFKVNDGTFLLFKAIEVKTRQILPLHLKSAPEKRSNKAELVKCIAEDETVALQWRVVAVDVIDEEDSNELLHRIVDMWVTMRGFALTSKWMEDYKQAKDKALKKSKSLRKQLKGANSDDK